MSEAILSLPTHGTLETPALPPTHVAAEGEVLEYLALPSVPGLRRVHDSPPIYTMENFLTDEVMLVPLSMHLMLFIIMIFLGVRASEGCCWPVIIPVDCGGWHRWPHRVPFTHVLILLP